MKPFHGAPVQSFDGPEKPSPRRFLPESVSSGAGFAVPGTMRVKVFGLIYFALFFVGSVRAGTPALEPIFKLERRAQVWVRTLRAQGPFRIAPPELSLTIEKPEIFGPEILVARFEAWRSAAPASVLTVLEGDGEPPARAPRGLSATLGELHGIYLRAQRWEAFAPDRGDLTLKAADDLRGYYRLGKTRDLEAKLRNFAGLPEAERAELREDLRGLCRNKYRAASLCGPALDARIEKDAVAVHAELAPAAQALWDARFAIPRENRRGDLKVLREGDLTVFELPFRDPEDETVWNFVRDTVERAWRGPGWELRLKKIPVREIGYFFGKPASIEFQPDVIAKVLSGRRIILDAKEALTDEDAIRTLRHEFGHVLGFPDCYLEFFDVGANALVNYQLDAGNIMCSKTGRVTRSHFEKLLEAYGR